MISTALRARIAPVVGQALAVVQRKRLDGLRAMKAERLLLRKNPYLFAGLGVVTPADLAEALLAAHISSSEETIMGNSFFEPIARESCAGQKSDAPGVDIRWDLPDRVRFIAVKSGTSVFNSSSKKKQSEHFASLRSRFNQAGETRVPEFIVGYCYGRKTSSGGSHLFREFAGKEFWTLLTGDDEFHSWLFETILVEHRDYDDEFRAAKAAMTSKVAAEISEKFASPDGSVDWLKVLRRNSG